LIFFFSAGIPFAQEGADPDSGVVIPVEIRTETSSASPTVNIPWSVYIMVKHPNPQEVNVRAPRFPQPLILERVRSETRFIRREQVPMELAPAGSTTGDAAGAIQGDRWTRVEFLFTPISAGTVTIRPFEITVLNQHIETAEITVRIRETTVRQNFNPQLRWQGQVNPASGATVVTGERAEFFLELTNWDPSQQAPRNIFHGRAPRNAILEESLPAEAGRGVYRYSVFIIPLEGSKVELESFLFRSGSYTITVPAFGVPVLAAVSDSASTDVIENENPPDLLMPDEYMGTAFLNRVIPFPENWEKKLSFFNSEYNAVCARVRDLWDRGLRAEALAEIRRNERDSLIGRSYVSLRRDMEQALGLGFTEDEKWLPLRVSVLSWVIAVFLIISAVSVLLIFRPPFNRNVIFRKNVTSRRLGGFKAVIVLVLLLGLTLIFLEEGIGNLPIGRPRSPGKTAVLRETQAYRVPDSRGAVNARFGEGQPVIVGDSSLDWCSAESPDGRYGWVRREAVITY